MMKKPVVIVVGFLSLFAQVMRAGDALTYFKNYFVTGDVAVAGIGLRGTGVSGVATGTINIAGVPCMDGSVPSSGIVSCATAGAVPADIVAAFLYWGTEETAATPAAANGFFDGNAIVGKPIGNVNNLACSILGGGRASGRMYRADVLRYLPIDQIHHIQLANGPHTVKLPDSGTSRSGAITLTNGASLVVIYRIAAPGNPALVPLKAVVLYDGTYTLTQDTPDMTQTVGGFYQASGSGAKMTAIAGNALGDFVETLYVNGSQTFNNPFSGAQGARWDTPGFNINLGGNASSFTVDVSAAGGDACIMFGALVSSTPVVDSDLDGLLDVWETNGLHLNPGDATHAATFGGCADYPSEPCENLPAMGALPNKKDLFLELDWLAGAAHVHAPKIGALTQIYTAFNAQGISVHFDVGTDPAFQSAGLSYIVPASYAQGGLITDLNESALLCPNAKITTCAYSEPYAVTSYKRGFSAIKSGFQFLNISPHFAHDRKDIFHYVLFGHALAGPFDASGHPLTTHPASVSGVADRPGGDVMLTLGLWRSDLPENDQTGSVLVQAGTLMHELGHNLGLLHAGLYHVPNCMPNYQSSMNYQYQTRGLTDSGGVEHIDYSRGLLAQLNENSLASTPSLGSLPYRVRFYAPLGAHDPQGGAAQLHCDGTAITNGALEIRLENPTLTTPDWTNGVSGAIPDINFNGTIGDGVNVAANKYFVDSNDWANINLQQIGSRPSVNGLSPDLGAADLGAADLGAADLGAADLGAADLGAADLGAADLGAADLGAADLGELDYDTATLSTVDPPRSTPFCPTCGLAATNEPFNPPADIKLVWTAPETGRIDSYNIYRCAGGGCTPTGPVFRSVSGGVAMGVFLDTVNNFSDHTATPCPASATCYNISYTYSVTSVLGGVESIYSTTATGLVRHLFVVGDNKTRVYGDATPLPFTATTTGLVDPGISGTTTCSTTATVLSDVGTYAITCSGLTPIAGVSYSPGVLSITKATAVIVVAPYSVVSDSLPHTATGTATGVGGANLSASLNLSGTTHTAVGVYSGDPWSFSGGINYFDASGTVTDTIITNAAPFVTGFALSSPGLRNNFAGFEGMQLTVGAQALSVSSLGRVCVAGNSQTHTVKLVSASTNLDVPGASAAVNMASCTAGAFVYSDLTSPITLTAGSTYYLVSLEIANGDMWYETGAITAKTDATVSNSAYFNGTNWITTGSANTSYVPPNMKYAVIPPPSLPNFVLNYNLNNQGLRNDFGGYAGMNLRVGPSALNVTSVGRACAVGNSQSHLVKFVNAATGQDVASAAVNMVNCTASRFVYAALAAPVTLAANTQYYLVSQEFYAGDRWYDQAPLSTKPDATVLSSVYWNGAAYVTNALNTSYVPPDFQYSLTSQPGTVTVTVGTIVPGPAFTVDGASYTTTQTFSWVSNSQHTIATTTPQSAGTGARYVFSSWSDGGAISHTVAPTVSTGYTANFTLQNLLTTNVAGNGAVVATPSSADGYYNLGAAVQLQANANAGSVFSGWTGDLSGAGTPQSLTMSSPRSVTATFQTIATGGAFVTSTPPAGAVLRNDYPGYVGMKFTMGPTPLVVNQLGRWTVAGNSGMHILKLVQANGVDLPGGSVSLNLASAAPGQYTYAGLASPVTLLANTSYFLMTQEFAGGDRWYDYSLVTAVSAGAVNAAAYQQSNGNYIALAPSSSSYGPPNFLFTSGNSAPAAPPPTVVINSPTAGTVSGSVGLSATATPSNGLTIVNVQFLINSANVGPLLTTAPYSYNFDTTTLANGSYTLTASATDSVGSTGTSTGVVITVNNPSSSTTPLLTGAPVSGLRHDYAGFVGLEFTVGSTPIQVSQLGRWVVAGSTGTHKVKLVDAVTGLDITGGFVNINTQTATSGQYAYAALASPLTLAANHPYFLLTQETNAGDFWYDAGTVKPNTAVTINGPAYQQGNGLYTLLFHGVGSYGPVSLLFGTN